MAYDMYDLVGDVKDYLFGVNDFAGYFYHGVTWDEDSEELVLVFLDTGDKSHARNNGLPEYESWADSFFDEDGNFQNNEYVADFVDIIESNVDFRELADFAIELLKKAESKYAGRSINYSTHTEVEEDAYVFGIDALVAYKYYIFID